MKVSRIAALVMLLVPWMGAMSQAQYVQVQLPLTQMPEEHEYQRELRAFVGSLSVKDLTVELKSIPLAEIDDPEELYRLWVLAKHPPRLTAATLPAEVFTLGAIESKQGLAVPIVTSHCQMLAWLADWDYPGNPYKGSRALKLRGLVLAAIDMSMLDYLYEHDPRGADRADYLGGNLIWLGYTYLHAKDVLTATQRQAFETGLRKLVEQHLFKWGPKGLMTDMDLFAPVGLWYVAQGIGDSDFTAACREYSRQLFTNDHYFNPAGYFVDNGCFDVSYNGISLYFGSWAALATDWDFTKQALRQALRLRAHLCFIAPDGSLTGPSAMSSRTSADSGADQWQFAHRLPAERMIANESAYRNPLPDESEMRKAHASVIGGINQALAEPTEASPSSWREGHWSNFINYAYEHTPKGHYAQLQALMKRDPQAFEPLYRTDAIFMRAFDPAFVIAKQPTWGGAVHTGPVGRDVGHNGLWYGSGGGQLAAFWTPNTGTVLVNRTRGVQGEVYNLYGEWRSWPVHNVIGLTGRDELVTSGRIQQPEIAQKVEANHAVITASGVMPMYNKNRTATSPSDINYQRRFELTPDGATITTTVKSGENAPWVKELYETIPVYMGTGHEKGRSRIWFGIHGQWVDPTSDPTPMVQSIRVERFDGAIVIEFVRPRTVQLAPREWSDGYQTTAHVRAILVNLIEGAQKGEAYRGGLPAVIKEATCTYTIKAEVPAPPADR